MRTASPEDRRYLLFNPLTKMKVTTEGERVIDELWDVMAAKGFERDMFFEMAAKDIRGLPKLEGTVHVNMALVLKFMAVLPVRPGPGPRAAGARARRRRRRVPVPPGPGARALGKIRFSDWRAAFEPFAGVPNVARFAELAESFKELLVDAAPDEEQQKDLDYLLTLGELFTLIPYGAADPASRRSSSGCRPTRSTRSSTSCPRLLRLRRRSSTARRRRPPAQADWARAAITRPVVDGERFDSVFAKVRGLAGTYEMQA